MIRVNTSDGTYDVLVKRGALGEIGKLFRLDRRVLVVTDDGVPKEYADAVMAASRQPVSVCLKSGEASKSLDNFKHLLESMLDNGFTREDCVVAVGGGVVGDIAGFCASCYMRGVDFYNVPTTLLSQVDSSIGGKTAIDFCGVKNVVGSFYQPKAVLIDPDVLRTLDKRQLHAGLVEAIKMGATSSRELFELIKNSCCIDDDLEQIVHMALEIKRDVVQKDTKEQGLRRVLNFGHTVGHAIEGAMGGMLLHGECVGIGMLYCASDEVKKELVNVLEKYSLPTSAECDRQELMELLSHDKKASGSGICAVVVDKIGSFRFVDTGASELLDGRVML